MEPEFTSLVDQFGIITFRMLFQNAGLNVRLPSLSKRSLVNPRQIVCSAKQKRNEVNEIRGEKIRYIQDLGPWL